MLPEFPPQFWLAGIVAYTGVVMWLAGVHFLAKKGADGVEEIKRARAEDRKVNDARLDKAEANSTAIITLTGSMDRLADRLSLEVKRICDRHDDHQQQTNRRLEELSGEIKHIRRSGDRRTSQEDA